MSRPAYVTLALKYEWDFMPINPVQSSYDNPESVICFWSCPPPPFQILNLFLALLLNSFDVENLRQEKEDDGKKKVPFLKRIKRLARRIFCCRRRIAPRDGRRKSRRSVKSRQVAGKHSWESTELTKPVEASKKEVTDRRISDTLDAMRSLNVSKALPATTGNTAGTPIPVRRRGISESSTTTFDLPTPGDKRSSPQVGARQRQTSESSIGVPTVLVTGTGQETDVPFQTVETRRTSIEETMVSTGTGQERHLSVTHTRIRSSSFTSTKSASNKSSNTNLLAIRHDDSQVSLSSRQNAAANSAAGVGPGLDGNCCTCVSNYQCGCLWCLCACCFSGHKAPTSPDDIEIVELTPQSKDYADDDLDDNKEDDTSLKDTVALAMSRCRAFLADVVTHSWFDNIILLLVVFSSISLVSSCSKTVNQCKRMLAFNTFCYAARVFTLTDSVYGMLLLHDGGVWQIKSVIGQLFGDHHTRTCTQTQILQGTHLSVNVTDPADLAS